MAFRVRFDDLSTIECDTAREAWELLDTATERIIGTTVIAQQQQTAAIAKPPRAQRQALPKPEKPARSAKPAGRGSNADKAEAYLRKLGRPQRRSQIARECGIPKGSMTPLFRDARFVENDDQTIWLAEAPAGKRAAPAASNGRPGAFSESSLTRARNVVAAELCAQDRAVPLRTLAKSCGFGEEFLRKVLDDSRFEQTVEGYVLAS